MDGRADVVPKTRQREFGSAGASTNGVSGLEHEDAMAGPCQCNGSCEAIRSRADDDSIIGMTGEHSCLLAARSGVVRGWPRPVVLRQRLKQRLRLLEVSGVKPLGEPAIDQR